MCRKTVQICNEIWGRIGGENEIVKVIIFIKAHCNDFIKIAKVIMDSKHGK